MKTSSTLDTLKDLRTLSLGKAKCLKVLEVMLQTRFMDDKMNKLVRQNKGGTFHLSVSGHELIGAVSALSLIPEKDWGLPYYRDRSFAIGLGSTLKDIMGAFLARSVPHHSGGRMMPEHFSHRRLKIPCQSSVVGSQFHHAVGLAKGLMLSGKDEVVYVSCGDGATSQGDFHEAINFACVHRLGVIFVVQDNGWAISVPIREQTAGGSIVAIASGYPGLTVYDVDGCNYEEVSTALAKAVQKARAKEGPSLVVAKVPRIGPHSSSDDPSKYKQADDIAEDCERDPIPLYEKWLLNMDLITQDEIEAMHRQIREEIEDAAKAAEGVPFPDPSTVLDHVFLESTVVDTEEVLQGEAIVMMDAINHALIEEMERDPGVVVFGQDVAHGKGGVFGITRTLTERFGKERCFNTPLAESCIIGSAIGMALDGVHKPVAEIQFADYMWTGINQLFNELSSLHYRSNGEWHCPVVIRLPYGGYIQGGPYHSQSVEAFLCHCPGLKVVIPSNAADAKRLLKTAIRDPNPVIFLEHKALYRQRTFCARQEPNSRSLLPFGKAQVAREGSDLTLVAWGMMVVMAHEVTQQLAQEGIQVEVIDLRTLNPLDLDTILTSVKKTGKLLIAHEAALTGGFGAEIAARVAEKAFHFLDAPIKRLGALDCCVPYCKDLENAVLPQKADLMHALKELASY